MDVHSGQQKCPHGGSRDPDGQQVPPDLSGPPPNRHQDWIATASGLAAAIGLLFTGYQVWLLNRQARHDRRVVLGGVAVAWRPVEALSQTARKDGTSRAFAREYSAQVSARSCHGSPIGA